MPSMPLVCTDYFFLKQSIDVSSLLLLGWVRILHDMALNKENIVYSLLASTILANLDRPKLEKFVGENGFREKILVLF